MILTCIRLDLHFSLWCCCSRGHGRKVKQKEIKINKQKTKRKRENKVWWITWYEIGTKNEIKERKSYYSDMDIIENIYIWGCVIYIERIVLIIYHKIV